MRQLIDRLFGRRGAAGVPVRAARWVVIDCETSGLDPERDRLLALGAVAVRGGRIEVGESFGALLRQETASGAENILVHGIGGDAQRSGLPAAEVLPAFVRFLGEGLPVAFHAPFDAAVLRRALLQTRGPAAPRAWLDLARLAPALYPSRGRARHALDDWLAEFGIPPGERHSALGDAFATAQLLLVLLAEAERQGVRSVEELRRVEGAGRWIAAG